MSTRIEALHLPSKQKLREELKAIETALQQCKDALNVCQEIQDNAEIGDKKLETIEDIKILLDERKKTAQGILFNDFMES